jgi:hypothetical protein
LARALCLDLLIKIRLGLSEPSLEVGDAAALCVVRIIGKHLSDVEGSQRAAQDDVDWVVSTQDNTAVTVFRPPRELLLVVLRDKHSEQERVGVAEGGVTAWGCVVRSQSLICDSNVRDWVAGIDYRSEEVNVRTGVSGGERVNRWLTRDVETCDLEGPRVSGGIGTASERIYDCFIVSVVDVGYTAKIGRPNITAWFIPLKVPLARKFFAVDESPPEIVETTFR